MGDARTAWAVVTGAMIVGWAVVVALVVVWLAEGADNVKIVLAGVIGGAGAALILFWRMRKRP